MELSTGVDLPSLNLEYILYKGYQLLTGQKGEILSGDHPVLIWWNTVFYPNYVWGAYFVSFLLLIGIAYASIRLQQVRAAEDKILYAVPDVLDLSHPKPAGFDRWQKVISYANDVDPFKWRLAIIEADVLLDELLSDRFYGMGNTIGERLKAIDRSDLNTIDEAWEAHRARNAIAHEGSDFQLSERETKRIIQLFEQVFNEFNYI